MSYLKDVKNVTTTTLREMKANGEKIAMLTCYDFTMARILENAGIDVLLVGDSASNIMAGHSTTLPITLEQMIYHAQSVAKAAKRAMVIVDMPFGTYQSDPISALQAAIRIMKETGAHALKLEGGAEILETVHRMTQMGIPVMGHLGLTPQSIHKLGSYKVQAKEDIAAEKLKKDATLLEEAGCFGVVLEKVPSALAATVTQSISIPTIGIGAGIHCDGQVLVAHDMLGLNSQFKPKFLRVYADLEQQIKNAISTYITDVKNQQFPNESESY